MHFAHSHSGCLMSTACVMALATAGGTLRGAPAFAQQVPWLLGNGSAQAQGAGIGRRLELGRFRSRGPRHLLREGRCTAERARSGRKCHHAGGLHQAATVEWAIYGIPPLMLVADDASERPYSYCAAEKRDELASLRTDHAIFNAKA